jgi:hypothetical protein
MLLSQLTSLRIETQHSFSLFLNTALPNFLQKLPLREQLLGFAEPLI